MSNTAMMMGLSSSAGGVSIADVFSTDLWTGTSTENDITNGLDLSGEGGLVWIKRRDSSSDWHRLFDTENGATNYLRSNAKETLTTYSEELKTFNADGFTLGTSGGVNGNNQSFVGWSWRKAPKFFDLVTYSGTGVAGLTVDHNLGSVPGMILVKSYDDARDWAVYHRGVDATNPEDYAMVLQSTVAREDNVTWFNDTAPTDTQFTVGNKLDINRSGYNYVAYLFAHNEDLIQCGSFVQGTSSYDVDLGFEPQWLLIKSATSATNWYLFDNKRGVVTGGNDAVLLANGTAAEASTDPYLDFTSSGFTSHLDQITGNQTYIYMAIKAE